MTRLTTPLKLRNAILDTVTDFYDIVEHKTVKDLKKNKDMMLNAVYEIRKNRLETISFIQKQIDILNLEISTLKKF